MQRDARRDANTESVTMSQCNHQARFHDIPDGVLICVELAEDVPNA